MTISVLMCVYNESTQVLSESINSVLHQSYKDFEFIIILDNPQNKELAQLLKNYKETDDRIKLYTNDNNIGLVNSLNRGIHLCNQDYIARMDADDIADEERFARQIEYIRTTGYDIVGCNFVLFSSEQEKIRIFKYPASHEECVIALKKYSCVPHPTWIVNKKVYQYLGGYRPINTCEDYDLLIRAVSAGYKIGNCQDVLLKYRYNPNSISRTKQVEQKLISLELSAFFSKDRVMTMEEYYHYIQSKDYSERYRKEQRKCDLLQESKCSISLRRRMIAIIKLLFTTTFFIGRLKKYSK